MSNTLKDILYDIVDGLEKVASTVAAHEEALVQRGDLQRGDIDHNTNTLKAHQEMAQVRGWIALLPG